MMQYITKSLLIWWLLNVCCNQATMHSPDQQYPQLRTPKDRTCKALLDAFAASVEDGKDVSTEWAVTSITRPRHNTLFKRLSQQKQWYLVEDDEPIDKLTRTVWSPCIELIQRVIDDISTAGFIAKNIKIHQGSQGDVRHFEMYVKAQRGTGIMSTKMKAPIMATYVDLDKKLNGEYGVELFARLWDAAIEKEEKNEIVHKFGLTDAKDQGRIARFITTHVTGNLNQWFLVKQFQLGTDYRFQGDQRNIYSALFDGLLDQELTRQYHEACAQHAEFKMANNAEVKIDNVDAVWMLYMKFYSPSHSLQFEYPY
eukprot:268999_1